MINVTRRLKKDGFKAKLILQIHDELLLEVPVNEQEAVSKLLVEEMENVCKLSCDLVATMNCASNWYDLK